MRVGPATYEGSESRIDFAAGARVEKLKGGGWGLGIPEETRPIIRRMAANYCDFTSMAKILNFANFSEEIALIKAVERGLDNARVLTRRPAGSVPEVGEAP